MEHKIAEIDKRSARRLKNERIELLAYAIANDRYERKHFEMEIEVLEAERLRKIANRYGISSFPTQEMYDPQMKDVDPRPYFSEQSKVQLKKMISEARFNHWKKRLKFLVPIISLIVAILALLKK